MWNLRALTHTDGTAPNPETTRPIELGAPREQGRYCPVYFESMLVFVEHVGCLICKRIRLEN